MTSVTSFKSIPRWTLISEPPVILSASMARISVLLVAAAAALAQTGSAPPAFEVASVKPIDRPGPGRSVTYLNGGPGTKSPTRLAGAAYMKTLLMRAYGVKSYQLTAPAWTDTALYEINAAVPPAATADQANLMLRTLLEQRLHLAIHRETRELPFYALLVGRNGPTLKQSDPADPLDDESAPLPPGERPRVTMGPDGFPQVPPGARLPPNFTLSLSSGEFTRIKVFARHRTMEQLSDTIASFLNRPVKDLTGLAGLYDYTLAFETDPRPETAPPPPDAAPRDPGPTIFTAVQSQLGLRLEQRKGPVEMLIVDRLEKVPAEN